MAKSTTKRRTRKVSKPPKPDGFPLTPHNSGLWSKKIKNPRTGKTKIWYFTRWGRVYDGSMQRLPDDGKQDALKLWLAQKDDLLAGREPRVKSLDDLNPDGTPKENTDVLTLRQLCNKFLIAKDRKLAAGEITSRTRIELKGTTDRLIEFFGRDQIVEDLTPEDFGDLRADIAKQWGPVVAFEFCQFVAKLSGLRPCQIMDRQGLPNKRARVLGHEFQPLFLRHFRFSHPKPRRKSDIHLGFVPMDPSDTAKNVADHLTRQFLGCSHLEFLRRTPKDLHLERIVRTTLDIFVQNERLLFRRGTFAYRRKNYAEPKVFRPRGWAPLISHGRTTSCP